MPNALQIENVSIEFGGLKAVQNVSMNVAAHEIVGLIGPNGAGKTTLFNLITGIYRPTHGKVMINQTDISNLRTYRINGVCHAARTFQNIRLFRDLSVLDNVLVAAHSQVTYGLWATLAQTPQFVAREKSIRSHALDLLQMFDLRDKADEMSKNLPYGEQRKLEIVRALATHPSILFLDEPAAGMNERETTKLLELIQFIRTRYQIAILVIEHDMKFIMGVCERIYVLDHGTLIAEGKPTEIQKNPEVIRAYLGEDEVAEVKMG